MRRLALLLALAACSSSDENPTQGSCASVAGDGDVSGCGAAGLQATCTATVSGGTMSGSCASTGLPSCSFSASRQ